jgi:hypothetical protein
VLRKHLIFVALVPALIATGCGGSDKKNGSPGNELSSSDQLAVIQAWYDIDEFCTLTRAPHNSDLYIRGLSGAVDAGTDLVTITKKDRDKVFAAKALKLKGPMSQITANEITKLQTKCGADGKTLAAKMRRAVAG